MPTFTTAQCGQHGHPEFTLTLRRELPAAPERTLIEYFEHAVQNGARFQPGQTIGFASQLLRLVQRPDGTLGLEELTDAPGEQWEEHVDHALSEIQRQVWISDSLPWEVDFPRPDSAVLVSECFFDAYTAVLTRVSSDDVAGFSGWMLSCADKHEHGERKAIPLRAVAAIRPFCSQFLALPDGVVVVTQPPGTATVFFEGDEALPAVDSYLDKLNKRT